MCVVLATHVAGRTRGNEMNYLSHVVKQRPMLRVVSEVLLAFGCAAPLMLLLFFLI